jgi:hypothetical protein
LCDLSDRELMDIGTTRRPVRLRLGSLRQAGGDDVQGCHRCTRRIMRRATSAAAETQIERGGYLVNAVMACDGCHMPLGPSCLNMERRFSGGSIVWNAPAYTVRGSNITPDSETGIGAWSENEIKRLLTSGVRRKPGWPERNKVE